MAIQRSIPALRSACLALAAAFSAALLTACSGVRTVQSDVQSYSTLQQLPSPPTYRLQLLPSQQAQAVAWRRPVEAAQGARPARWGR